MSGRRRRWWLYRAGYAIIAFRLNGDCCEKEQAAIRDARRRLARFSSRQAQANQRFDVDADAIMNVEGEDGDVSGVISCALYYPREISG